MTAVVPEPSCVFPFGRLPAELRALVVRYTVMEVMDEGTDSQVEISAYASELGIYMNLAIQW